MSHDIEMLSNSYPTNDISHMKYTPLTAVPASNTTTAFSTPVVNNTDDTESNWCGETNSTTGPIQNNGQSDVPGVVSQVKPTEIIGQETGCPGIRKSECEESPVTSDNQTSKSMNDADESRSEVQHAKPQSTNCLPPINNSIPPPISNGTANGNTAPTSNTNVAKGPNFRPEDTLFIFDWDDTIMPTTWLAANDIRVDSPESAIPQDIRVALKRYSPWPMKTLAEARKYGTVLIVTNAEEGWIELTVKKFFPDWDETLQLIEYHSARSTWERTGCALPVEWKVRSFSSEIEKFYRERDLRDAAATSQNENFEATTAGGGGGGDLSNDTSIIYNSQNGGPLIPGQSNNIMPGSGQVVTGGTNGTNYQQLNSQWESNSDLNKNNIYKRNIIGMGDSTSDREAMIHVTQDKVNTIGKSLKFMERPNLDHLQKQHHLIASSIKQIVLHEKTLDLCIQHQPSEAEAPPVATDSGNGTGPTI